MFEYSYKRLLSTFLKKKYTSIFFNELNPKKDSQLILRHDIDLDINLALEMAKIENSLEMKSTYFFLARSESYNLISDHSIELLNKIKELGHRISIHFDLMQYKDVHSGLIQETELFKSYFEDEIDIISIHRPNEDFLSNPENFFNIKTSYEKKFTKENISYFADSGGSFRFGNPIDSLDFRENKNIQLLTHPVWWTLDKGSVNECVESVLKNKNNNMRKHFQKNIKTFK
jgi:hypothetical protein